MTDANLLHYKSSSIGAQCQRLAGEPVRVISISDSTDERKRLRHSWRYPTARRERVAEGNPKPEKHIVASYRVTSG